METSCGLVLSNLGSILLLQYPQGHWDLPKGHVEDDDEDHIATVRRELEEETGFLMLNSCLVFVKEASTHTGTKERKCQAGVLVFGETERIRQA